MSRAAALQDTLPRAALLRLLAVLTIVLLPHVMHLPLWATLLVAAVLLWRGLAALRGWRAIPRAVRVLLALAAFAGVYASFGRVSGQTAGVALLVVMAGLKLTELNARRDLMIIVLLMYFLLITHFLFSQELWTAAYLIVCTLLVTAVLIDANHPGGALPFGSTLRLSGRLVLMALPLMLIIFVLFPRIPGPLWGLPSDAGAARSGLSDSMSPGEISSLVESDAVAFRVRFEGAPPPNRERYWRGPVFGHFDGRRWDGVLRPNAAAPPQAQLEGGAYRYEVTLEPQRSHWLFALELPAPTSLPSDASLDADFELLATREVRERRLYRIESFTQYRLQGEFSDAQRSFYTHLPARSNPRTQALGQQWRAQGLDDAAIVDAALTMFRREQFFYTLHPPVLGRDSADEFLFDTRRGFCEHYAGSFTVLMRAAGVPARVVTGYQGGEKNPIGDYYVVRQSDAHAWSEVWLGGRGWVRVDPTAAVAPQRIERGISAAFEDSGELPAFLDPRRPGYNLRYAIEARWDWINAQWNHWVLGYGPDLQQDFLRRFGLIDWSDMIVALTAAVMLVLAGLGWVLLRQFAAPLTSDAALQQWQRVQRRLARSGLPQRPDEGPLDFARRVALARPELAAPLAKIASLYLQLRYLQTADAAGERRLAQAVAEFRT
ncbi:MAG: hypothetical protein JWR16_1850 [Nevskia sp.]|nr:hypothetical protein [Nevskia sp.]